MEEIKNNGWKLPDFKIRNTFKTDSFFDHDQFSQMVKHYSE